MKKDTVTLFNPWPSSITKTFNKIENVLLKNEKREVNSKTENQYKQTGEVFNDRFFRMV